MRVKAVALTATVILAVAFVVALISASKAKQAPARQQIEELEARRKRQGLSVKEHVKLAKLRNERKVTVPSSYLSATHAMFPDMETAAALSTIVVAKPVAEVGRLSKDGGIVTSYKFQTVETLSEPGPLKYPFTFSGVIPPELGALGDGEYMVTVGGGTKEIDGVEVTMKYDDYELFSLGKEYLLFLQFDTTGRLGAIQMGPMGALKIGDDGKLEMMGDSEAEAVKEMIARFGNSLHSLRAFLKSLPKRQN